MPVLQALVWFHSLSDDTENVAGKDANFENPLNAQERNKVSWFPVAMLLSRTSSEHSHRKHKVVKLLLI